MTDLDEQGRPQPPRDGDEVATLLGFLDYQRATLAWKCGGVPADGMRATVGASSMTLGGLLKHMAHRLRYANALDVLIYLSLFWIAPFYGFFSVPYFLAVNIVMPCPERQLIDVLAAAVAMALAYVLAETTGTFLSKGRRPCPLLYQPVLDFQRRNLQPSCFGDWTNPSYSS